MYSFNIQKSNPPIARCAGEYSGRVSWVRSFQKRIDEVMNNFKKIKCIIEHVKMQSTIHYYNTLAFTFKFYEMQIHKVWFDNIEATLKYLSQPVLVKNPKTQRLELNFHHSVLELIKESESMLKLGLGEIKSFNLM